MCTSGARLQLAIAPAGAGKTTAMRTLARAWSDSGGQVVGLAPSAAAAAQLRDHTGALTDFADVATTDVLQRRIVLVGDDVVGDVRPSARRGPSPRWQSNHR